MIEVVAPQPEVIFQIAHLVGGVLVTDQYNSTQNGTQLLTHVGCPISITLHGRDKQAATRASATAAYRQRFALRTTRAYPRGGPPDALSALDGAALVVLDGANPWNGTTAVFAWTPLRGQEGAAYTLCFDATDPCGWAPAVTICVAVAVAKCRACLAPGGTLQALAADYGTDFLSLYSTNVGVRRPGRVPAGALLNLGVRYAVRPGDGDLAALAARLLVTPAALLAANPDAAFYRATAGDAAALRPGDSLCVLLPVCGVRCGAGADCAVADGPLGGVAPP